MSFPKIISGEEWDRVSERNAALEAELEGYRQLDPWLPVAQALQAQVVELLGTGESAEIIGELAYKKVLADMVESGRAELAVKYERQHRQTLYQRLVAELEETEGPAILESVVTRLETDAALAVELRDSARKELTAKAKGVIKDNVTTEQKKVIDIETERLMSLDRLDVGFALTGLIDLDAGVSELLMPGDKLDILFKKDTAGQAGVRLVWASDIHGATGWTLGGQLITTNEYYYRNNSRVEIASVPRDRFLHVGARVPDLQAGGHGVSLNSIRVDHPLALEWPDNRGENERVIVKTSIRESEYSRSNTNKVPGVAGIDFQTRDLNFVDQKY